jgi:SAM-dependent methyltransferase
VLLPLDEVASRLRCPRTGAPVAPSHDDASVWATTGGGTRIEYPVVAGRPAIVDFDRSILDRQALLRTRAESLIVRRRGGLAATMRRLLAGRNEVAAAHCRDMIDRLVAEAPAGVRPTVLVVGGGTLGSGAEALYDDARVGIIAFDIYASPLVQFVADAHAIPLADASVDGIWVQAVLEHVLDPSDVVGQMRRVLRPGGIVYAETPFMQQVHEGPFDFHRFSAGAHRWLFRQFEAIDAGTVAGPGTVLLWSWRYFVAGLMRSRLAGALAAAPFFWLRLFDRLIDARHASDGASCVFFYGRNGARSLTAPELIASYPGAQR